MSMQEILSHLDMCRVSPQKRGYFVTNTLLTMGSVVSLIVSPVQRQHPVADKAEMAIWVNDRILLK